MAESNKTAGIGVPEHIQQTIDAIEDVHARHSRQATPAEHFIERSVRWVARPSFIVGLTAAIAAWVAANLYLNSDNRAFDPPPFPILQDIGTGLALYITVLILITAQREKEIGEHREQLTLQLAILADQKNAKIIQLIEEARHDNPMIGDREDVEATKLSVPADPAAVLDAIKDTHGRIDVEAAGDDRKPASN